jgi:hypothetical protein
MTLEGGGGGPSAPTSSTTVTSNIPEYAEPYVTNMLDLTQQQLFKMDDTGITGFEPYQPYSTNVQDYFAGFSPLQRQAQFDAGAMEQPGQFALGSGLAGSAGIRSMQAAGGAGALGRDALGYGGMGAEYGAQAAGLAPTAQALGRQTADIGAGGLGYGSLGAGYGNLGVQAAGQGFNAGNQFAQNVTNPNVVQSYMSPYQQNVTDVAKQAAVREAQIAQNTQNLGAARQGTYGGARQTLAQMERERNLLSNLSNIQTQGSQSAYDRAMQTQQFGANLGLQGLQAGYGGLGLGMQGAGVGLQGIGTALQGQQGNLAALGQAGQFLGQGMQGAQAGMQGVQGAIGAGQFGLQGLGQAGQMGTALGQLGATQQGTDIARQNQMATMGAQQQALEQNRINQAIQDYSTQQQYPLMQLGFMSNMLRGLPMEGLSRQTYAPQPSYLTQGIGTVGALGSLASAFKGRKGGLPKDFEAPTGIKSYNVGGSIESKLNDMSPADLQSYIKETSSPMARQIAEKVLRDKVGRAGGGIVAFQNRGKVDDEEKDKEDAAMVRQAYIDAAMAERPTFDRSKSSKSETKSVPLTERLGRALGIKDAGRQMPTKETTAMPLQASGSDVPMVARSPELAAAERAPVNPASIVAATPPRAEPRAEPRSEPRAEPKAEPRAAPAVAGTGIKAVPSDKIMPTAGIKLPAADAPFGLEAPVSPDANKTIAQIAAEKEAYMGPNVAAQQDRARLMAEKANAVDEAKRATSMRMAEFFAAWGSTPGSTIVAGLYTLRNKIPDFISDQKEETRIRRAIDKDIAELEKIERLEKSGNYDQAAKRKAELSKESIDTWGKKVTAASNKYVADVNLQAAGVRAAASGSGGEGKAGTLYNQAVIRFQTEEKNIATAKEKDGEYRRALIKLRADPKNAEALATKNAKEAGWNAKLKERQADVDYYKNKQGREARVSGESEETNAPSTGKVIQYDAKGNRI